MPSKRSTTKDVGGYGNLADAGTRDQTSTSTTASSSQAKQYGNKSSTRAMGHSRSKDAKAAFSWGNGTTGLNSQNQPNDGEWLQHIFGFFTELELICYMRVRPHSSLVHPPPRSPPYSCTHYINAHVAFH
jgi:hypothetical protein